MSDWQKLVDTTIKDYWRERENMLIMSQEMYKKFMAMHTPEYIAKAEAARKAEQARLAAIEAAKTPAQRLREKQEQCDHEFGGRTATTTRCKKCKKFYTTAQIVAYREGHDKGYDAGRESVDDCY